MSEYLPPLIITAIAVLMAWPLAAWTLTRLTHTRARATLTVFMIVVALGLPWILPADLGWLRFVLIVPCFVAVGKTIDILTNGLRSPEVLKSARSFFVWSMLAPDAAWPASPEAHEAARARGVQVALGALPKLLAATALLALNSAVPLHSNLWLSCFWMCFVLYFGLSGLVDLMSVPFRLAGLEVLEIFNAPPLARNPRDFWSRRWNLWFTRCCNKWIFQPLGGAKHPLRAVSAVFIFSGLQHEYMVVLALQTLDGRMTLFFWLHGAATIVTTSFAKRLGRRTLMPRVPAILLHIAWFALTAPLFFGPLNDILNMSQWRLW